MGVGPERTAARKWIRTLMAHHDLSAHDLAKVTGYSHAYIRGVISGAFGGRKVRQKIETALGLKPGSIWTDLETEPKNSANKQEAPNA